MLSGKQILLEILRDLSTRKITTEQLQKASDRVRAGFLLHGSTGGDSWEAMDDITWDSMIEDGKILKQGLALSKHHVFLSDLFEVMTKDDAIPDSVRRNYPEMTLQDYRRATHFMWLILSSVQWFDELSSIEKENSDIAKEVITNYIEKLQRFRTNSEDFQ